MTTAIDPNRALPSIDFDRDSLPWAADTLGMVARRVLETTFPALPLPGSGLTLTRWRALADIAAADVCLVKVLEAHYDAVAILRELGHRADAAGQLWAVWAAEPPDAIVRYTPTTQTRGTLTGTKAWCSGADLVTHALLTVTDGDARLLVAIEMGQPGISKPASAWNAVGMSRVVSGKIAFHGANAQVIGKPGEYLSRPGFWHGGAGIAACWFGAAVAIAETLRTHRKVGKDPHATAHLGAIDMALSAAAALLRETAALIDASPHAPHITEVTRVRSLVERTCSEVIDRVGRALGAGPLCQDKAHAQRCADLATFVRQSHAEQDWVGLGRAAGERGTAWRL